MVNRIGAHDAADEAERDTVHGDLRKVQQQPMATGHRRRADNDAKVRRHLKVVCGMLKPKKLQKNWFVVISNWSVVVYGKLNP